MIGMYVSIMQGHGRFDSQQHFFFFKNDIINNYLLSLVNTHIVVTIEQSLTFRYLKKFVLV